VPVWDILPLKGVHGQSLSIRDGTPDGSARWSRGGSLCDVQDQRAQIINLERLPAGKVSNLAVWRTTMGRDTQLSTMDKGPADAQGRAK
jgi:hypothetical protein